MNWKTANRIGVALLAMVALHTIAHATGEPYAFHVLNQRSIALTAQYWNPILIHVSRKSGVPLELRLTKTITEGNVQAEQGAYEFLYTNHFFTPERDRLGFRVLAKPAGRGIQGQIVVPKESPIRDLQDLNGREIAFPSADAFAAYYLPMDSLIKAAVHVRPVFTSNQEASLAQLKVGSLAAAAVNDQIIERYARREGFEYRTVWRSEVYNNLCIMVSPKVPKEQAAAVRDAFINMTSDAEGIKVLRTGADLLKMEDKLGFIAAESHDYDNYRAFFRNTAVRIKPDNTAAIPLQAKNMPSQRR